MRKIFVAAIGIFLLFALVACYEEVPVAEAPPPELSAPREEIPEPPRTREENQERYFSVVEGIHSILGYDAWPPVYPEFYGGIYFNDDGRLTVLIVETLVETDDALYFLAQVEALGGAVVRYVEFSERDLRAAQDYIWGQRGTNPAMENVRSSGLDTIRNRVTVQLLYGDDEHIKEFRREVLDSPMLVFYGTRGTQMVFETPAPPLRVHPPLVGAGLRIYDDSNLPAEITVAVYNYSDYKVYTGFPFSVEAFYDGEWWVVPMSGAFVLPAFVVETGGGTWNDTKNLSHTVGSLQPGLYRIRKDIYRMQDVPIHAGNVHDVVAEFSITR